MSETRVYGAPSDLAGRWVRETDMQVLRAENARLRGLLAEIQFDCEHLGGIQQLDKAERRTWVSVANRIKAALQPKEAQP